MRRLVYLYVSNGSAHPDFIPQWNPDAKSVEPFAHNFQQEGFYFLFCLLLEKRIFDEILIVIESSRSPGNVFLSNQMKILVVPHLNELKPFMRDNDILWARGGWRSWFTFLSEWHDQKRWLLFYRAASNRGAWPFWDIVLDDLRDSFAQDKLGRFYYPISKPTNPMIFSPEKKKIEYDIMIGASHIHDKKGQFRMLRILDEYREKYHKNLKCIMPGSIQRGAGTSTILPTIKSAGLDIFTPGMVPREKLAGFYNQSSLFVHCGGAGQNDRGPLEALSCGTPIMLSMEQYHAPGIRPGKTFGSFLISPDDSMLAAVQVHEALESIKKDETMFRSLTVAAFQYKHGIDDAILPEFMALFRQIQNTPYDKRQEWFNSLLEGAKHETSGND